MQYDSSIPKPQIQIIPERVQKSRDHSGLVKGLLAFGGAAVLADQGADSSIIGEYASNVMNERVPSPSTLTSGTANQNSTISSSTASKLNLIDAEGLRNVSDGGQQYKRYADLMYQKYKETGNEQFYVAHQQTVMNFKGMIKR